MATTNNYVLPRGRLYFAQFLEGTTTPTGERFIGNVPELNLTFESETLDHYASTGGIRQKDDSVILEINRTGSMITDDIDPDNVAIVFLGSTSNVAVTGATVTDEPHNDVVLGRYYQLGKSPTLPSGHRGLDEHTTGVKIVVKTTGGSPTTYAEGTDYVSDLALGRFYIPETSTIVAGSDLVVSYKTKTSTRKRIISGGKPVEGELRFIADNPKGDNLDYYMPYVKLSANGDFSLVGGDEWQQIPLNIEVLKLGDLEAVYCDGRPVFA